MNCSILLKDRSIAERLQAVRQAGFTAVEFWWPFAEADPGAAEVAEFIGTVRASGLSLVGLNLFAGDMAGGDRGVVSWPDRTGELLANVQVVRHIGEELGCRSFNALYGNRRPDLAAAEQDACAEQVLGRIAAELAPIGGTVLIEPVSGTPAYPIKTADDAVAVIDRVAAATGAANLGLLLDMYHLAANGDDVPAAAARHRRHIAHVQVADLPGRGAPGSGDLPLGTWLDGLAAGGYTGWTALEYASGAADPLGWARTPGALPGIAGAQGA
ncbi:TIM barrel protein [Streptomonospora sediminis]